MKSISYYPASLNGRYITMAHILPYLQQLPSNYNLSIEGYSVLSNPIYSLRFGTGDIRIYMWSQMHGNESTTTKALLDWLTFLENEPHYKEKWFNDFSFLIIPIANPDGALDYTRVNANDIDLNRNMIELSQPESQLLWNLFENFNPHYAFNLHDQRTIFSVGATPYPATLSFLAPSFNEARDINSVRQKAIDLIVCINNKLQEYIPNQIGRFDDSYNANCIGDCFQSHGVPTILFEAGHYPNDYEREQTRKYVQIALVAALKAISENVIVPNKTTDYLAIPKNKMQFFDIIYRNVKIISNNSEQIVTFAIQYTENLVNNKIEFVAYLREIGELNGFYGHKTIDAQGALYTSEEFPTPQVGQKADFKLNNQTVSNGLII